jgi:hypothetical protein
MRTGSLSRPHRLPVKAGELIRGGLSTSPLWAWPYEWLAKAPRSLQTKPMKNTIFPLIVALGLFSLQASAKEITVGTISGQKALAELLTNRFSNLENQTCIQEALDNAKLRNSLVAIGMRLTAVTLHPGTSPVTGGPILYVELNYSGENGTPPVVEYPGNCTVRY